MSNPIGNKTPANTYNDLFYLNNNNLGVDSTLRSVYSGNGTETGIQISEDSVSVDFNKKTCKQPLLDCYFVKTNDLGSVSGAVQISTSAGNIQKMTITNHVTLTILSNLEADYGFEFTLIIEQSVGAKNLTLSGNFKTPSGINPLILSTTAGKTDIVKIISYDGGDNWYAYKVATEIS